MKDFTAKRVRSGLYEYVAKNGKKYEVVRWERPCKDDYGPEGEIQWYYRPLDGDAETLFETKREAVEAMKTYHFFNGAGKGADREGRLMFA